MTLSRILYDGGAVARAEPFYLVPPDWNSVERCNDDDSRTFLERSLERVEIRRKSVRIKIVDRNTRVRTHRGRRDIEAAERRQRNRSVRAGATQRDLDRELSVQ